MLAVATITLSGYSYMVERSNRIECMNNLTQIQVAIEQYREANNRKYPEWLSLLVLKGFLPRDIVPSEIKLTNFKSVKDKDDNYSEKPNFSNLFLCPSDQSLGMQGGKPDIENSSSHQYPETDHHTNSNPKSRLSDVLITPCSYLYEINGSECSWWDGYFYDKKGRDLGTLLDTNRNDEVSWQEAKYFQLHNGDVTNGSKRYPANRFPVVRCFWHIDDIDSKTEEDILNISDAGNIYWTTVTWETTANKKK